MFQCKYTSVPNSNQTGRHCKYANFIAMDESLPVAMILYEKSKENRVSISDR